MPVQIGSKFTGQPKAFIDTTNGVYWEALPKIEGHALIIQQALINKPQPRRRPLLERIVGTKK